MVYLPGQTNGNPELIVPLLSGDRILGFACRSIDGTESSNFSENFLGRGVAEEKYAGRGEERNYRYPFCRGVRKKESLVYPVTYYQNTAAP